MSQEFLDPEILADFLIEAREHLETIEPNLLELERDPENLGLLDEIFRPMHSLKGASGFLGLNKMNGLAHRAENILDELRNGKMQVTEAIMDVILAATDQLRTIIENLADEGDEGDVDTGPLIEQIEALMRGEQTAAPAAAAHVESVAETALGDIPDTGEEPQVPAFVAEVSAADLEEPEEFPDDAEEDSELQLEAIGEPYKLSVIGEGHLADFLEEASELVENLNQSLLELEKDPSAGGELVNDTFRYFHNLKGNSGIIGFRELNTLTHEAETLLNRVRHGEIEASRPMIDLLLAVCDAIESLINSIDVENGEVQPLDISIIVPKLQKAAEGQVETLRHTPSAKAEATKAAPEPAPEPEPEPAPPGPAAAGFDPEDVEVFEQTASQQFVHVNLALETLRKEPDNKEFVDGLYRSLTTIQNSASYMGFDEINTYAERTAGLVDQARKSDMSFDLMNDILAQETEILREMVMAKLEEIGAGAPAQPAQDEAATEMAAPEPPAESAPAPAPKPAPEPKPEPTPKPAPEPKPAPQPKQEAAPKPAPKAEPAAQAEKKPRVQSTIRVDHEKLDHLMNLIGELIITRNRFSMLGKSMEEGTVDTQEVAQSLIESTDAMARISDDLQDTIMNVRMVPVQSVFSRFPRLVRDLSRKSGKKVELIMEGEETELDKSVVEVIGDPLVHMIRNSVDHGIEATEEERIAAGKNPVGHIYLRAYHKGNSVAIEVEDDGRGIDPEKMRKVGVKKGLVSEEEARNLDDREAVDLIFAPGFSSADQITDISGRGVGMDVVRTNIKNLKGAVNITSEVGKGTKFIITLPLTLAIIDALMVNVSGEAFAIPLDAVSETTKIEADILTEVNQRKAVTLRGEVLGIVDLAEMLDLPVNNEEREILPIVVIQDNERRLGLVVDRLLERQEIVIKPLGVYLNSYDLRGVSGATIMGDGSVVLILDTHEVYTMATRGI